MNITISRPSIRKTFRMFAAIILAASLASCVSLYAAPRNVTLSCSTFQISVFPGDPVTVTTTAKGLDPKLNAI